MVSKTKAASRSQTMPPARSRAISSSLLPRIERKDLRTVLGEGRRRSPGRVGLAVDPHTGVHLRHFAAVLADHSIEQTALAQARIGRHLVQPMDRAGRDAVPGEQSEPMVPFARAENLLDPGHELRPRRSSPGVGRESWLVGHRGLTDGAAKPPPDGIVAGPEGERLVGGPED